MEIWKDVVGFEGLYQVSNLGRVKSLERYLVNKNGVKQFVKERIKKGSNNGHGYINVSLWKENTEKHLYIHRLVAQTFIPNQENKPQVNHINGIRNDNRLINLEWVNNSENVRHTIDVLGYKHPKGGKSKLSIKINQYDLQGNFIKTWGGIREAERGLGYTKATSIYKCCKGRVKQSLGYIWSYAK